MRNFLSKIDRYIVLTFLMFGSGFFYGSYDTLTSEGLEKFLSSFYQINKVWFYVFQTFIVLLIITAIIKMQKVVKILTIYGDDEIKWFKVIKLILIGYFIGTLVSINDVIITVLMAK